ncbi:hypothetical protein C4K26_0261 [Pseudomonas chlororaphis]|uniref:hypothetical protein n=1 Tax=Pseudomonas chlororaphis TaxID=587753 RepID=UPI000F57269B|nr:hypothetical protein [Pseudomonas chlororaphis]AZD05695.1 hypothetical protein C4K26_0261 [Pseudomonas chlororaphis]
MNLLALLKGSFCLSEDLNSSTESISNEINEEFFYKNDYTIKKACKVYKNEVCIQKGIADSSNRQMPGFNELIIELKKTPPDAVISMRFIDSDNWSGRVFFDERKNLLGLILGKKKNKTWVTPPNWDGSEEMLKKYNTENK